jgi:hypothetical protein
MRCPTCGQTAHPGYIVWRGINGGDGPRRGSLIPCPDCAGSVVVSCCEGRGHGYEEVSRPYRYYVLDDRGMIVLAEINDADSDAEAEQEAANLLRRNVNSCAIEVWDLKRRVHVARRPPVRRPVANP